MRFSMCWCRPTRVFLASHGMTKGGMALIDEARAASIYRDMGPATEMSGGSAANTIVGVASLGARAAYVGKVRDDQIGRHVRPRHPRRRRRVRDQAGRGRPRHRLLLYSGDAGRRAHHEHLSRRGAGTDARRYRRRPGRGFRASSISKAISGIRRAPRKPS